MAKNSFSFMFPCFVPFFQELYRLNQHKRIYVIHILKISTFQNNFPKRHLSKLEDVGFFASLFIVSINTWVCLSPQFMNDPLRVAREGPFWASMFGVLGVVVGFGGTVEVRNE